MRIDFYSHYFKVSELTDLTRKMLFTVAKKLVLFDREYEDGRYVTTMKKIFAFSGPDGKEFKFPLNFYSEFAEYFQRFGVRMDQQEIHHHEMRPEQAEIVEWRVRPNDDEDREYQSKINTNLHTPGCNKVINLQPGAGKTKITLKFVSQYGVRTQAIMKSGYLSQWAEEIDKYFYTKQRDVMIIQGNESLRAMMQLKLDGELEAKFILVAIETFANYLTQVEKKQVPDDYYPIHPDEYFVKMGIGLNIIDEGHQNIHRVARLFCSTNVLKNITLSATLDTKDKFNQYIYDLLYPKELRDNGGYKNVYIMAKVVHYQMQRPGRIRHIGYGGAYSHTKFEESISTNANRREFNNYMQMIKLFIQSDYINVKKDGQKAIIFFSTKKMCTFVQKFLQKEFPFLKVARYIGEDKREVMDGADLIVSTVLSAGTAVDIPNLIVNFLTIGIDSQISNEQTLGRTRPVKNEPGRTPWFVWFSCDDIPKHCKYTANKKEFFSEKVVGIVDMNSPISI